MKQLIVFDVPNNLFNSFVAYLHVQVYSNNFYIHSDHLLSALATILPILLQYCYKCYNSDSQNL